MKLIVLNKGQYEPAKEQFSSFFAKPEDSRNLIYSQRNTGNLLESIPRIEKNGCVIFPVRSVEEGNSLALVIGSFFRIDREQIFLQISKSVYYSGWLAYHQGNGRWLEPSTRPPFRSVSKWKFRKALAFKNWEVIDERNLPVGSSPGLGSQAEEFPASDKIIEVWCLDWEYYDKIVFSFYFDYTEDCFWSFNRKARELFGCVTTSDKLPLSEATRKRVKEMSNWYRTCLDWSNPGGESPWTEDDRMRYNKAESRLREDLRKELGDEYEIVE
jgi:hypothetical protein